MIKLTCSIFIPSNKSIFFNYFFFINFFSNIKKIFKDSSAKYYEDNKERLQKKPVTAVKVFLKKRKKKSDNMIVKDTNIFRKMKNRWFSIEKNY